MTIVCPMRPVLIWIVEHRVESWDIETQVRNGATALTDRNVRAIADQSLNGKFAMTEPLGIGPLQHRRGVGPVSLSIWIVLAAVGGAITWGMYGNDIRSVLKLPPAGTPEHWVNTRTEQNSKGINVDEIVGLVKDLQVSQQHTADDVRTALQLLTAEQAATKTLSDAVAALQAKVDSLQRPVAPPAPKKLVPSATRKPSAPSPPPPPPSTSPDQDQPEPEPGAPAGLGPERR